MKIKAVEKHAVVTELGTAVFVGSAQMILKLGIATVALVGGLCWQKGDQCAYILYVSAGCIQDL